MGDENYVRILEKMSKASNVDKEELERRVEAKRAKLSGLISKEGAAQVIAAELGINFDNEKLKINEILPGMRKVNVVGKVINLFPVRTFTRKGQENKVVNFVIADDTSNVKIVLWDVNHIELIEKGEIKEGSVVEVSNGSVRDNEIHLGSFSELKMSNENFDNVVTEKVVNEKKIIDFKVSDDVKTRAFIVQAFEPRFFHVCPECNKKATQEGEGFICAEHGKVVCEKRGVANVILDDGTETIRAVAFHDNLGELGFNDLEDSGALEKQRNSLLGKEMIFSGSVRNNKFFNNKEIILDQVKEVDIDNLIQGLEKS